MLTQEKKSQILIDIIHNTCEPLYIFKNNETGEIQLIPNHQYQQDNHHENYSCIGILPAMFPEWLGSLDFLQIYALRYPYIVGEMANGIATADMVIAAAKAGMLGFFGAAGLMPNIIEENLQKIQKELHGVETLWGSNLIHSPQEPFLEEAAVNLYLKYNVRVVSASAFMSLSTAIVRYAYHGVYQNAEGHIVRKNHVIAKISRAEVAKLFMQPAPENILQKLLEENKLTQEEVNLARHLPIAEDITVEADSGGHTDNRPLTALFPVILQLAEEYNQKYNSKIRVGAAGGIGTPSAVAAAFSLGAAYVLTGSINQSAVESGLSQAAKEILSRATMTDVMMAPAADMFELGVKLQVLKRETLFAMRANKLYEIYTQYNSIEEIPENEKQKLESQIFLSSLDDIWQKTKTFFTTRDPKQIEKAEQSPKYKMALVFRWYLGLSSSWAIQGDEARKVDYQIWCGPAMGAFNQWVKNSYLEDLSNRTVACIGINLLEGAVAIMRAQQLRSFGIAVPQDAFEVKVKMAAGL